MSEPAVGIHAHPTKKLGKRPPKLAVSVDAGAFLRPGAATLPAHPGDDPVPPLSYPMDRNNVAGDCVVAGLDHALQTIYAALGVPRQNWTDAQLLAYYQTQNPLFRSWADGGGPNDGGMDIQTFLEHLVATGEIVAFGRLDHTDEELLKAATYVGLAVVTGELLDVAQQNQQVWDYVAGSPQWGGHCTTTVAYQASPDEQDVVTWGGVTPVTQSFVARQIEEAWFVLTKAHLAHPGFRDAFDIAGFAQAVSELTGGKVVVPVPPSPQPPAPQPPTPQPPAPKPPAPADPLADFPWDAVDNWADHPHRWHLSTVGARAFREWKSRHQL